MQKASGEYDSHAEQKYAFTAQAILAPFYVLLWRGAWNGIQHPRGLHHRPCGLCLLDALTNDGALSYQVHRKLGGFFRVESGKNALATGSHFGSV